MTFSENFGGVNEAPKTNKNEKNILETYNKYSNQNDVVDLAIEIRDLEKKAVLIDSQKQQIDLKSEHSKMVLENMLQQLDSTKSNLGKLRLLKENEHGLTFALQHMLKETGANLTIDGMYGPETIAAINGLPLDDKDKFYSNDYPKEAVIRYLISNNNQENISQDDQTKQETIQKTETEGKENDITESTDSPINKVSKDNQQESSDIQKSEKQLEDLQDIDEVKKQIDEKKELFETKKRILEFQNIIKKGKLTPEQAGDLQKFVKLHNLDNDKSEIAWIVSFLISEKKGVISKNNQERLQQLFKEANNKITPNESTNNLNKKKNDVETSELEKHPEEGNENTSINTDKNKEDNTDVTDSEKEKNEGRQDKGINNGKLNSESDSVTENDPMDTITDPDSKEIEMVIIEEEGTY